MSDSGRSAEAGEIGEVDRAPVARSAGAFASFARFVVCGGGMGLVASALVPKAAEVMPWALANALITVVTTLLCTELHSFITFRTGRWAGLRRHLQSAGSAAGSYALTTAAVLVLHAAQPRADRLLEQAVYLGAAGLAGIARFLVLRLFVFDGERDRDRSAPHAHEAVSTALPRRNFVPGRFRKTVDRSASTHVPASPAAGPRRLGLALVGCGVALVMRQCVGLDPLQAIGLAVTGILLLRRDPLRRLAAAVTAALLVVHAWFDVLTSLPGTELAAVLTTALGAELPLATVCVVLTVCSLPPRVGPGRRGGEVARGA